MPTEECPVRETAMSSKQTEIHDQRENEPIIFHHVETSSEEISGRARTIAVWLGLFACAILVSQFGRPSRAREAEFLRGAAKVEALGRTAQNVPNANPLIAGADASVRNAEVKQVTPAAYVSKKYGVAWQYSRSYVLRKGANANLNLAGQPAAASALANEGTVTLATVNIPARLYAGTDFRSASLTVRVNPQISENACGQIKISAADGGENAVFPSSDVTVGTIDFTEASVDVDDDSASPGRATQEKFYHVYDNDACYEFAMSVSTDAGSAKLPQAGVERDEIFERLNEILTSVTIVPRKGYVTGAADGQPVPR